MLDAIHMNPNTFWTHDGLRSRCKSTNSLDLRIEKAVCFVFYAASRLTDLNIIYLQMRLNDRRVAT